MRGNLPEYRSWLTPHRLTRADLSADGREPIDAGRPTRGVHLPHRGSSRPWRAVLVPVALVAAALAVVVAACGSAVMPSASPGESGGQGTPTPSSPSDLPEGSVDIGGGRHLDIACQGSGSPVVVLDAGLGNELDVWSAVMTRVAEFTTVCAYNRAGLGTSDLRPPPHGAASAVDDLHALLGAAGLPAPYVLVGASFGGLDAQLYARRYPAETAGVVLVDAIAPEWDRKLEAMLSPALVAERRAIPNGEDLTNEDIRASELGLLSAPPFPPVPLVVLRHGRPFEMGPDWPTAEVESLWTTLQEGLAAMSPQSASLARRDEQPPDPPGPARPRRRRDPRGRGPGALAAGRRGPPGLRGRRPRPPGRHPRAPRLRRSRRDPPAWTPGATEGTLVVRQPRGRGGRRAVARPGGDAARVRQPAGDRRTRADRSGSRGDVWLADLASGAQRLRRRGRRGAAAVARRRDDRLQPARPRVPRRVRRRGAEGPRGGRLRRAGRRTGPGSRCARTTTRCSCCASPTASGRTSPTGPGPNDPTAWSPDGSQLALSSTRDGDAEIYVVDVDGSGERRLTDAPGGQVGGPWLPEGLLVASSLPDAEPGRLVPRRTRSRVRRASCRGSTACPTRWRPRRAPDG